MAEFTFYTVAMSRGQISRWALHEAGADYDHVMMEWETRPESFKAINPMNKVPALVHHHQGHDHVVTECAAINHYLAETHPQAGLLPDAHEKAAYFRWLFFAAGPLEQAVVSKAMGWEVPEGKTGMAGFGSLDAGAGDAMGDGGRVTEWISPARGPLHQWADTYVAASSLNWGALRLRLDPRNGPRSRPMPERVTQRPALFAESRMPSDALQSSRAAKAP